MSAGPATTEPEVYDSAVLLPPFLAELRDLCRYRDLLLILIWRDFATRYKRSWLGVAWSMLNPMFMMIVLSVVFTSAFPDIHGYPAYVIAGIVPWTFFAQTTSAANRNILWGGKLFKQVYLPKASFVVAIVLSGAINMLLSFIPLAGIMLVVRVWPGQALLLLPYAILCLLAFTLGMSLLMATIATFYADVAELYYVILTGWMYITPIIWSPQNRLLGPLTRCLLLNFNPMADLIELFHHAIFYGTMPASVVMLRSLVISSLVLCLGWAVFTRNGEKFSYRI